MIFPFELLNVVSFNDPRFETQRRNKFDQKPINEAQNERPDKHVTNTEGNQSHDHSEQSTQYQSVKNPGPPQCTNADGETHQSVK